MGQVLHVSYRGPLRSCNYRCGYCPFSKVPISAEDLLQDELSLDRFVGWVLENPHQHMRIMMTPYGEGLIHAHYQRAFATLTAASHVERCGIQTNGSWPLGIVDAWQADRVALWLSFHPGQTQLDSMVKRSHDLFDRGIAHSIGIVGTAAHLEVARDLRAAVHPSVYCWVNAYRDEGDNYYDAELAKAYTRIDPLFGLALAERPSMGRSCSTGGDAVFIDGDGVIHRCHFDRDAMTTIEDPDWQQKLHAGRPCTQQHCHCYIGYSHLEHEAIAAYLGTGRFHRVQF